VGDSSSNPAHDPTNEITGLCSWDGRWTWRQAHPTYVVKDDTLVSRCRGWDAVFISQNKKIQKIENKVKGKPNSHVCTMFLARHAFWNRVLCMHISLLVRSSFMSVFDFGSAFAALKFKSQFTRNLFYVFVLRWARTRLELRFPWGVGLFNYFAGRA
jgi:hypothetical protein